MFWAKRTERMQTLEREEKLTTLMFAASFCGWRWRPGVEGGSRRRRTGRGVGGLGRGDGGWGCSRGREAAPQDAGNREINCQWEENLQWFVQKPTNGWMKWKNKKRNEIKSNREEQSTWNVGNEAHCVHHPHASWFCSSNSSKTKHLPTSQKAGVFLTHSWGPRSNKAFYLF